jgi:hypothetical protein
LLGIEGSKKALYDNDKLLIIKLEKATVLLSWIVKIRFGSSQEP